MLRPSLTTRGFTFIELLVTTSIIALLITIATVAYRQTTLTGRDSRRKQDLEALRTTLEFYRVENGSYPTSEDCSSGQCSSLSGDSWIPELVPEYISILPSDPLPAQAYLYRSSPGTGTGYKLEAQLEADGGTPYVVTSPQ